MNGERKKRVVVVGLDGATFDIINPMVEAGELPNLQMMIEGGAKSVLNSVIPPYSPPAWISMLTGKNPGRHGIFHFLKRKKDSYDLEVCSFRDVREDTLFSIIVREGAGSAAINIPMTYPPPRGVKGYFVSGIPVPPGSRSYAEPADLMETLESGGYEVDYDFRGLEPNREDEVDRWEDYQRLLDGLIEIARKRVDLFLGLRDLDELPLLFFVISLTDRVQHYFWRFLDEKHPGYSEEGNRRFGDAIRKAYSVSDELLGKIVERLGDDADYLVVSDHGAGPHYYDFHLNNWLVENGYLKVKKTPRWVVRYGPVSHVLCRLGLGIISRIMPESIGSRIIPYPGRKRFVDSDDIIWRETRAFASMFGVRVNMKSREPEGIVEEGHEYRELLDGIRRDLGRLKNPTNGDDLLTECTTKEDAFSGPHLDGSPDMFMNLGGISVLPTEHWVSGDVLSPRGRCPSSGTHRMEGVLIGSGPSIVRGIAAGDMRIVDVLPTILHLLEVPIPLDLDGRVVMDLMVSKRPAKYQEKLSTGGDDTTSREGYTEEEEDQITENLRGMGYI